MVLGTGGSVSSEEGKASPARRVTAPSRSGKTEPRRDRVQAEDWLGAPSAEGPGSGHTQPVPGKQAAGPGSGSRALAAVLWEGRSPGGMTRMTGRCLRVSGRRWRPDLRFWK